VVQRIDAREQSTADSAEQVEDKMAKQQEEPGDFTEQRKFPRTGVSWPGTLETSAETVECTVVNLSANGARLKLGVPLTVNNWSGTLTIPSLGAFKARVAWSTPRGANEIGLTFQDPPAAVALALAAALPRTRDASAA
jgi:hypothetical protein